MRALEHALELFLAAVIAVMGVDAQQAPAQPAVRIVVPGVTAQRPSVIAHTAGEGETFDSLAPLFATTGEMLAVLNPGLETVAPGQTVAVPRPGPAPVHLPCGDLLAPLDREHGIGADCVPAELADLPASVSYLPDQRMEPRAADALLALLEAVSAATGETVLVRSSYRSYDQQVVTFQHWVDRLGLDRARQLSAEPGHSEHQLGTSADLTSAAVGYELEEEFGETAAGVWLAANAWEYGFIISYPEGAKEITGYDYEPWHLRWVGEETAAAVHDSRKTLHTYLLEAWRPGRHLLPNP